MTRSRASYARRSPNASANKTRTTRMLSFRLSAIWRQPRGRRATCRSASIHDLRRAVKAARPRRLTSILRPGQASAGSAPGIAQSLGRPLGLGERLVVKGRSAPDTALAVRASAGQTLLEGYFPGLRLRNAKAVVKVVGSEDAPRLVLILPDGRRVEPSRLRAWKRTTTGLKRVDPPTRASRPPKPRHRDPAPPVPHARPPGEATPGDRTR